ncbi:MAG: hypothetical protein IJ716_05680 [Lachnospiraceae bacterium]|nr:hypothetical protein [Lachnospiraceae bacterium]
MVKVHFSDWEASFLDVEKELGINVDVADYIIQNVADIELEATDQVSDMENNEILWFSSKLKSDEAICNEMRELFHELPNSKMKVEITIASDFDWYGKSRENV